MFNVGLIGFGGIAQAHKAAYDTLKTDGYPIRIAAACDIEPERFVKRTENNLNIVDAGTNDFKTYSDIDEMLANEQFDLVSVCLPRIPAFIRRHKGAGHRLQRFE